VPEVLHVYDGYNHWILYGDENVYREAAKVKPDKDGIRHLSGALALAAGGYGKDTPVKKAEQLLSALEVPWEELQLSEVDVQQGNIMLMTEKLARIAHYIVKMNSLLSGILARQVSSRDLLDHAVSRALGMNDDSDGKRQVKDVKIAMIISGNKKLKSLKIELIELGAAVKLLELNKESLDLIWRTVSRCISARSAEPIDR